MQLNISINLDNAAFKEDLDGELAAIFAHIINRIPGALFDSHGKTAGTFSLEEETTEEPLEEETTEEPND